MDCTRLVDRLARDGLLEREACGDDARGAFAVLTEQGEVRVEAARRTHLAGVRRHFLEHFDEREQDLLATAWTRIVPEGSEVCCEAPACSDLSRR